MCGTSLRCWGQREGVRIPDFELYSKVTDMKESDSNNISFYCGQVTLQKIIKGPILCKSDVPNIL